MMWQTYVRTYSICIAGSPSYVAYGQTVHPTDGTIGLLVTTIARASGVWRRALGISFVLCKKQAQLLLPNACDVDDVAAKSGCAARRFDSDATWEDGAEQCWCTSSGGNTCPWSPGQACEPDKCKAPKDCDGGGYFCFHDAVGCNILPDNAISQVIYPLASMLDRMGVHKSDYDLAHYFTIMPGGGSSGLGGGSVCSHWKALGASGATDPTGDSWSAGLFAHVSAAHIPSLTSVTMWAVYNYDAVAVHSLPRYTASVRLAGRTFLDPPYVCPSRKWGTNSVRVTRSPELEARAPAADLLLGNQ